MNAETLSSLKESGLAVPQKEQASTLRPSVRRMFFVLLIAVLILTAFFLIYQNGKSIYDNGL